MKDLDWAERNAARAEEWRVAGLRVSEDAAEDDAEDTLEWMSEDEIEFLGWEFGPELDRQPRTLKAGYLDYTVNLAPASELDDGETRGLLEHRDHTVKLLEGMHPQQEAETLLHEILHIAWEYWGSGAPELDEETAVSAMATGLSTVMRDNPWLLKYFHRCLAEE